MRTHAIGPALALAASALAGCSATRTAPAERPADFALALTVYPSDDSPGERYVVEPDGVLRAAIGRGVTGHGHPPGVRWLSPWEFDALYQTTLDAGLLDLAPPTRVSGPDAYEPDGAGDAALVYTAWEGWRRWQEADLQPEAQGELAAAADRVAPLRDRLRALTWQGSTPPAP